MPAKPGYLWTKSAGVEESVGAELYKRGKWSLDVIGTESVGGAGIVRDCGVLDIGVYGVSGWKDWKPEVGVGIGLSF